MNKKEIIKLLKLLKKDKKKIKKRQKKGKARLQPAPLSNIATLSGPNISQYKYQPGFDIPKFQDVNRIELEQFSDYKKTRGLLPSENRGTAPSELELFKEFEKVKKLSKSDIQDLLLDKNVKSQTLERQKILDKLKIDEEKRLQKEQKALLNQELKTKKRLQGIRNPTILSNQIISTPIDGFSTSDNLGLETAVGGTSDDFIEQLQPPDQKVEGPSLLSVASSNQPRIKRKYTRKIKTEN
jgi:hypothetical protein